MLGKAPAGGASPEYVPSLERRGSFTLGVGLLLFLPLACLAPAINAFALDLYNLPIPHDIWMFARPTLKGEM